MNTIANTLIVLIGLLHIWILVLEMFLWTSPPALKAFSMTSEQANASRVLAANQGLYNGFLAAGLLTSFLMPTEAGLLFQYFFLSCVAIAGIYGGLTANRRILAIQTAPALIALLLLAAA